MTLKRTWLFALLIGLGSLGTSAHSAKASSYYRVNLRAYRHYMQAKYPSCLSGVLNSHIFQMGGPFDQLVNIGLDRVRNSTADTGSVLVAQRVFQRDQDLANTQLKLRQMCEDLGIPYEEIESKNVPTLPPGNGAAATDQNFFKDIGAAILPTDLIP